MEKKIGVYICGGCGIGEAVDADKLAEMCQRIQGAGVHPSILMQSRRGGTGPEGYRRDGVNGLVIAACSPRAKTEVFSFDPQDDGVSTEST